MRAPPQTLLGEPKQVTQEQIGHYAEASGDHNPLHLDPAYAAETPYGRPIAHGMLVLAFVAEMMAQSFGAEWSTGGRLKVRFRAPVYPGDTVTAEGSLRTGSAGEPGRTYTVACRNQSGEQVIIGEASVGTAPA